MSLESSDAADKIISNIFKEDIEEYFPAEEAIPEGWLNIEEHLPMVRLMDVEQNGGMRMSSRNRREPKT